MHKTLVFLLACGLLGSAWANPIPHHQAALTCSAPGDHAATPPCGARASLGPSPEPGPDTGISNPIHAVSGEKFLRDIDLPEAIQGDRPAFVRLYRSGDRRSGPLGVGWTLEYDIILRPTATGYTLHLADGRTLDYGPDGRARRYLDGQIVRAGDDPPRPRAGEMPPAQPASPRRDASWRWQGPDGRQLDFDAQGRLSAVRTPGRPVIHIERNAAGPFQGLIRQIRQDGRHLRLRYARQGGQPLLQALHTPLGTFRYTYRPTPPAPGRDRPGTWQLIRVERPDGMRRHYQRDAVYQAGHIHAITGIRLSHPSGADWQARSWTYDPQGRVIEARPGTRSPDTPLLSLAYRDSGVQLHQGREEQVRENHLWQAATQADGLQIWRYPDGRIGRLRDPGGGWPGLVLDYAPGGERRRWTDALTGSTRVLRDPQGRLNGLAYANGDRLDIQLDTTGRPVSLTHHQPGQAALPVRIQWRGRRPGRLTHPAETEFMDWNDQGRLQSRHVRRPLPEGGVLQYREHFTYDTTGRLLRHGLPEGGALHYRWQPGGVLRSIHWEDPQGTRHPVIEHVAGLAGYRYGNGLHLQTRRADGRADTLVLSRAGQPLWGEHRRYDPQGRIAQRLLLAADGQPVNLALAHDAQGRLAGLADGRHTRWLAWAADGSLAGQRRRPLARPTSQPDSPSGQPSAANRPPSEAGALPALRRDPGGLPLAIGTRRLHYQALRRLSAVFDGPRELARYTHNARGQQIRQQNRSHTIERYYLDNRLVGRWVRPRAAPSAASVAAHPSFGISERYIYAQDAPVARLRYDPSGAPQLDFIHSDLMGAPVRVTDARGGVRWTAEYDAFGRLVAQTGDLPVVLRLPGQDEDPATGWHDNVFRTYLPQRGHYLEPDPLGPLPGQQALGYAAQRPLLRTDPLGLILLAFDGTRYGRANESNVWKLAQVYGDGERFYHAGPGNNLYMDWDAVTAASSGQILRNHWQSLMNALQRAQGAADPVPIDILGYSRGAALARDFANRIAQHTRDGWFSYDDPLRGAIGLCVDLRFLGLFDTVAQFGLLGAANAGYDLNISDAWSRVAHAVATHEMRSLFPLVTARGAANTIEAPFIGAHADIGGGSLLDDSGQAQPRGDLSDVALNWMAWQAMAAQVPMGPLAAADRQVTHPLLHDERIPALRLLDADRDLQDAQTRSLGPQGADARLGAGQRALFETFIQRLGHWELNAGSVVGRVDMTGYDAWLATQRDGD
ncbi:phospholipase effector Tle1 domain-containing protein [Castellaniella hirudinis]|uniref:phospholipase effector Tle1 domain-containing protein n=1 Tax=Castellaniella hirudinis TaxID=1144617 RepID=UPI0039C2671C